MAQPFPVDWIRFLEGNVGHYRFLSPDEQSKLRDMLRVFLSEKDWEGCGGLELTDEMRVTIAAQACMLILGLDHDCYSAVTSILVYPHGFKVPTKRVEGPLVTEAEEDRLGEAHVRGPVVLAWDDVLASGGNPGGGQNLVYHEFAHQPDFIDGVVDGTPPLAGPGEYDAWRAGMGAAFDGVQHAANANRRSFFGSYAATNPGEFFAVATERFFDTPEALETYHPTVYQLLKSYYRQDPSQRVRDFRHAAPAAGTPDADRH